MKDINKVILIGRMGADADVRDTNSGSVAANISLATTEVWKDKTTGERQERTEWHRVTFFGRLAEIIEQYARKGTPLYIEGNLRTRKWQDQDGQERYTTEVVADDLSLLPDGRVHEPAQPAQAPAPVQQAPVQRQPAQRQPAQRQAPAQRQPAQRQAPAQRRQAPAQQSVNDGFDDDIPF